MKLSIITINFNNLNGFKKTFDSVVNQTFTDYEWIVIDGGSTDGSREFIEAHKESFSYWVSEPDRGIYNAMNKGILQANGEYVNFMNSGDYYADNSTLSEIFGKSHTADILYGFLIEEFSHDVICKRTAKKTIKWHDLYDSTLPHQGSFIRRSLFDTIGLYDENLKVASDAQWFSQAIILHHISYKYIPQLVAIDQPGGISHTMDLSEESIKRRKGVFPDFITDMDVYSIRWVELLRTSKFAYFIFRIAVFIARQKQKFRIKRTTRQLLKSAGNLKD